MSLNNEEKQDRREERQERRAERAEQREERKHKFDERLSNEQLLEEVRGLFTTFDKDLDDQGRDIAFVKGIIAEMQRHNGRVIKVLAGVITALLGIITWLIAST